MKKDMRKKLMSIFLSLAMVIALFPVASLPVYATGTTFTWETATDNGATVSETVGGITVTVAETGGTDAGMSLQDVSGVAGSSGQIVLTAAINTQAVVISFSAPVDILSIYAVEVGNKTATWTYTPTGGSNSAVTDAITANGGHLVTLNWTGVTSFTVTSDDVGSGFAFDNLVLGAASSAPTVTLSSGSGTYTNSSPIPVTITFSESVSGFTESGISVTGGTVVQGSLTGSGTSYAVNITPSGQGTVTVNIAANAAQDAAGNGNTASAQLTRIYDTQPPTGGTISIESGAAYATSNAVVLRLSASGAYEMMMSEDSGFSGASYEPYGTGKVFLLSAGDGVKTVYVKYRDFVGNESAPVSDTITLDTVPPTVTLSSAAVDPTNTSPIPVTITFSEPVSGFVENDISVTGGMVAPNTLTGNGQVYTANIIPTVNGTVTVTIPAGAVQDLAGNANAAAAPLSRTYDIIRPSVVLSSTTTDPTNASPIPVLITFSEPVTGFTESGITVGNGAVASGSLSGNGTSYAVNIIPAGLGSVTVDIPAGAALDAAGNTNTAATQLSRSYAITAPGAPTGVTATAGNARATVSFTPPASNGGAAVTGYTVTANPGGITASGGASPIVVTGLANGTAYTFTVTATNSEGTGAPAAPSGSVTPQAPSSGGGTSAPTYRANVKDSGGVTLPVTVDNASGSASVTVNEALRASLRGGRNETITMPSIPNVTSYTLVIPVPNLSTEGARGSLTMDTDKGSVTVPSDMLASLEGINGDKAQLTIGAGDKSTLPDDVKAAIGDRPLIQLTLSIDGRQADWSNPSAPVKVTMPYTPTAEELAIPESIVVWYIDGSGNPQCVINGRYDPATGMVTFDTTHFSDYAAAYNLVSFHDVTADVWYHNAVSFIAAREITTGTGDGGFSPDAKLTRGEFIVLMMRAYGIAPDQSSADNFSDAGNTYYTSYLAAAKRLGISNGVGDNKFAPEQAVTRQEMFTLLYNALSVLGQLPQGDSGKVLSDFTDSGSIAAWAQEAMTCLVESGVVGGSGGTLTPEATTTRAQMAQILYNLLSQ